MHILDYLRVNNLITKHQHGFMSRRSTVTNLLESVNDWTLALNDKHGVVIAYIDYAKAFDTVCHAKLLRKLASQGISGDLLEWICVFLHDRSHCTRVNNAYSEYVNIHSGVIQGSVIGPLLFLIYVNDVTEIFGNDCVCKLYADDIKLYSIIDSKDDYGEMQTRLSELQCWSDQWQLTISYKKCSVLLLNNVKGGHQANLVLGDKEVSQPDCVKDLGVLIDQHLKFEEHIIIQ